MSTMQIGCVYDDVGRCAYKFTGKERDTETGLDYFGARYYGSSMGRFTSPDPIVMKSNRLLDPQRLNLYSYTRNSPLNHVDPDGRDAIAVVFPNYKISTPIGKVGGLGHAGIVTIDSKGHTRYFEYGRYPGKNKDAPPGRVQERGVVDVKMGPDGKPTKDSLNNLMKDVSSKAGQNGKVEGAYFDTTDKQTQDMNKHALDQKSQNESTSKEAYSLTDNNCGTFVNDTLKSGGVDTPWIVDPRPNSMSGEWRDQADQKVDYDPKKEKKEEK